MKYKDESEKVEFYYYAATYSSIDKAMKYVLISDTMDIYSKKHAELVKKTRSYNIRQIFEYLQSTSSDSNQEIHNIELLFQRTSHSLYRKLVAQCKYSLFGADYELAYKRFSLIGKFIHPLVISEHHDEYLSLLNQLIDVSIDTSKRASSPAGAFKYINDIYSTLKRNDLYEYASHTYTRLIDEVFTITDQYVNSGEQYGNTSKYLDELERVFIFNKNSMRISRMSSDDLITKISGIQRNLNCLADKIFKDATEYSKKGYFKTSLELLRILKKQKENYFKKVNGDDFFSLDVFRPENKHVLLDYMTIFPDYLNGSDAAVDRFKSQFSRFIKKGVETNEELYHSFELLRVMGKLLQTSLRQHEYVSDETLRYLNMICEQYLQKASFNNELQMNRYLVDQYELVYVTSSMKKMGIRYARKIDKKNEALKKLSQLDLKEGVSYALYSN